MPDAKKILITGASGLLGNHLVEILKTEGFSINTLSRRAVQNSGTSAFSWNPDKNTMDPNALKEVDTIINLAGASISSGRWTERNKHEIIDSRLKSLDLLYETIQRNQSGIKTLISASAIGIYGDTGEEWVNETNAPASGFLGETCMQWESSARKFEQLGIRVVILRIGIVLSRNGGALPVLAQPVRFFLGSTIGSGKQYLSWIHIIDLGRILLQAVVDQRLHGIYNAVAPHPVKQTTFMKTLAEVLHRPLWPLHIPATLFRLLLGEKSAIILNGQRVSSDKIRHTGFEYRFPELKGSLLQLYGI